MNADENSDHQRLEKIMAKTDQKKLKIVITNEAGEIVDTITVVQPESRSWNIVMRDQKVDGIEADDLFIGDSNFR